MDNIQCKICGRDIPAGSSKTEDMCEPCERKQDKDARLEVYNTTYEQQLKLHHYIKSLEKDIADIEESLKTATKGARRLKKLIKINERDINAYKKMLASLPPLPPFK